jgi:hypothetical protein
MHYDLNYSIDSDLIRTAGTLRQIVMTHIMGRDVVAHILVDYVSVLFGIKLYEICQH